MSTIRSLVAWSVVFTQVWTPVLAQTLPISVDKSVAGQKPVVGVANGVPVVNIAPPSAGGVSNNRYTQFNVGPSGVVLNNSGGASQTQLAGQVGGNTMLGNQRATTILNQVTAPNPSQLMGTLEVAGNRANVIVANPAGITCNGCGFLNANRATLTTGRPKVGPDGGITLDVAAGKLRVDGDGLYGANLSQVDLIARSLEINAGVWTDHLNVVAGAARVDYADGKVSALAGEGAPPVVALDTSALGGMYANSIRLIGTEAGVGVNVGGNLVALTGDLHVNAAGDVSIVPGGTVQAARALQVNAGRDLVMDGVAQGAEVSMTAGRDALVNGLAGSDGSLKLNAKNDLKIGAQGGLLAQDTLRIGAGRDVSAKGALILSDSDLTLQAGRNLAFATQAPSAPVAPPQHGGAAPSGGTSSSGTPGSASSGNGASSGTLSGQASSGGEQANKPSPVAAGVISSRATVEMSAGRDMTLPGQVNTAGMLRADAGSNIASDSATKLQGAKDVVLRAGGSMALAGSALADGSVAFNAGRDLRLDGSALAYGGALRLDSGRDLVLGKSSQSQGNGVSLTAAGSMNSAGQLVSGGLLAMQAGGDMGIDGRSAADGDLRADAGGALKVGGAAQLDATGATVLAARNNVVLAGALCSNGDTRVTAGGALTLDGQVAATRGAVALAGAKEVSLGAPSSVLAGGPVRIQSGDSLMAAGTISSMADLTMQVARDATLNGDLMADGRLSLDAGGAVTSGAQAQLRAQGPLQLRAGASMDLAGVAETNATLDLNAATDLRMDGSALAYGGALTMNAGRNLTLGEQSKTQGAGIEANAQGNLSAAGSIGAQGSIQLIAGRDLTLNNQGGATGDIRLLAGLNLRQTKAGALDTEGVLVGDAGKDVRLDGALRANSGAQVTAGGDLAVNGLVSTARGGLNLKSGGNLSMGVAGQALSGAALNAQAGGAMTLDGSMASQGALALTSARDTVISGQLYSGGTLDVTSAMSFKALAPASLQSVGDMRIQAARDATLVGSALTDGALGLRAKRDVIVDGSALAFGGSLAITAGQDLKLGAQSQAQGSGVVLAADRGLSADGVLVSQGDARLSSGGDSNLLGTISVDGDLAAVAGGALNVGKAAVLETTGVAGLSATGDMRVDGALRSNGAVRLNAGGDYRQTGQVASASGALSLNAGRDVSLDTDAALQAGGPLQINAGGALRLAGTVLSLADLTLQAARDAVVSGQLHANGALSLTSVGDTRISEQADLQSNQAMAITAGSDILLAGSAQTNAGLALHAGRQVQIDGAAHAYGGALSLDAGNGMILGNDSKAQGRSVVLRANDDIYALGQVVSESGISVKAGRDILLGGLANAFSDINLNAGGALNAGAPVQWSAGGILTASASGNMALAGALRGDLGLQAQAGGAIDVQGLLASATGSVGVTAGAGLSVASQGSIWAGGPLQLKSDADLQVAGVLSTLSDLAVQTAGNAAITGKLYADGVLRLLAGASLDTGSSAQMQSGGDMTLRAQGMRLAGVALSDGAMTLDAAGDLRVDGSALAYGGALTATGGNDLTLGAESQTQGKGVALAAGHDMRADGVLASTGDASMQAGGNVSVNGSVGVDGNLAVQAGGSMDLGAESQIEAAGRATLLAQDNLVAAGAVRSNDGTSLDAGRDLTLQGIAAAMRGALKLKAGRNAVLAATSQALAGGDADVNAGGNLNLAGKVSSLSDVLLQAGQDMTLNGQLLAARNLRAQAGQVLTSGADAQIQADGDINARSGAGMTLAGQWAAGKSIALEAKGAVLADAKMLAAEGGIKLGGLGDITLGNASELQAKTLLAVQSGGKLQAMGTLSSEGNINLSAQKNLSLEGTTVAGQQLQATAGATLDVTRSGLAQGSNGLRFSGQDVHIAGTAGTADTALAAGGTLDVQASRDLTVADSGIVSAGSSASLGAQRHLGVDGVVSALDGNLAMQAGGNLNVGQQGRLQAGTELTARADGDLVSRGTVVSGADMALYAGNDLTLDGVVGALGQRGAGNLVLDAGRDAYVTKGAQVQAAGTLTAQAARDLLIAGALTSVRDMTLSVARVAQVGGTASSDGGLTLTGHDVRIGADGLAQAGDSLRLTALGGLDILGRALGQNDVVLTAGDSLSLSGTTAALQRDLTLSAERGAVSLAADSHLQAGGSVNIKAGTDLNLQGVAAAGRDVTLAAGQDVLLGGAAVAQGGALSASAGRDLSIEAGAQIESASAMALRALGRWINAGTVLTGGVAELSAGAALTNLGAVLAGGDLNASAGGALNNAGRLAAGVDEDGALTKTGSLTLAASAISHDGTSLAGKDLTLSAGQLDLGGANLSALGKLALTTAGDIDTRLATLYGGTLAISGSNLNNQGGKITAGGDAKITLSGALDNRAGVLASVGHTDIEAVRVDNQAGTLAGKDLSISASGSVDNTGGLMQADNALSVTAAALNNRDTAWQGNEPSSGLIANTIRIVAGQLDNTRGSIQAQDALAIEAGVLDNTDGLVSSRGVADILADTLINQRGKVLAGERLTLRTRVLTALGVLQSGGDLSLTTGGSLDQTGDLTAGRDLSLSVGGNLDNSAKLSAGRDLTVNAGNLNNKQTGELVAAGVTTLNVAQTLTNAGLIDGGATRISAGRVDNLGRIYGDTIAIGAGFLSNDVGAAGAAVIASRGDLDLGVGGLNNREHALIYAGGNLRIGGALDGNGQAWGQAGSLVNASATIEAVGNAVIAAASIQNLNNHYASQVVSVGGGAKVYYRPDGSTDMYDGAATWLCDLVTPMCSKDPGWLQDDQERRLLLPSSTYPESRYGPPFDYGLNKKGIRGKTAPISPAFIASETVCTGGDAGGGCMVTEDQFFYPPDAAIWGVFGVAPPVGAPPVKPEGEPCMLPLPVCREYAERLAVYEAAHTAYTNAYRELNTRIRAFNADFDGRMVKNFTIYRVQESVTETRTVSSDPGQITVGGNATLIGAVTNDKSRIVAGGALMVSGPAINNIGATGERRVEQVGTATHTYEKNDDRKYEASQPYTGGVSSTPTEMQVAYVAGNQAVSVGGKPGASALGDGSQQIGIVDVALPDGSAVRTMTAPAVIPDSQLFAVSGNADSPYLVETDPRFIGQHDKVSSDYLLELLRNPNALPETAINGAQGANGGLSGDRISGGAGAGNGADAAIVDGNVGAGQTGPAVSANGGLTGERNAAPGAANVTGAGPQSGAVAGATGGGNVGAAGAIEGARAVGWDGLVPAGARFLTPSGQPKRLGDGFYEQKLVTDQIMATTGQRYLDNYSNADAQYKALLAAGAQFAAANGVQLGVALTEEQMRQLTTDVVWLVERAVVRADGTVDHVLVPQVYLMVRNGDLKADGTLMAGRDVSLQADGDVNNTGSIVGRDATVITAGNIVNKAGGQIQGERVNLNARENITSIAALIQGGDVSMKAGRDIALTSTMTDYDRGATSGSNLGGVSRVVADNLQMQAGDDINLTAAQLSIKEDARLQAGRDINLGTLTQSHQEAYDFRKKNNSAFSTSSEIGTNIAAGGNLTLVAGRDVQARAANVTADKQLAVGAGRDINLTAGVASGSARDELYTKKKGFLSRSSTHSILSTDWTQARSSTFTGDSVVMMAGRDVNVVGSNAGAQNDLVMTAGRDVNIVAGVNTLGNYSYEKTQKSGFGAQGGFSYGSRQQTDKLEGAKVFHSASTVGSVTGDTLINAGGALNIMGSNVVARQGDVTLIGREVNIGALADTAREKEFHEIKQSGLSISASTPMVSAMQTAERMGDAAGKTDNKVMQGLALATSGLAAVNAYDAITADPAAGGGLNVNINLGSSKSQSSSTRSSSSVSGSTVAAGGDLTIVAQGAGQRSNVTVTGSNLSAGNNAAIKAEGDILLQAAENTFEQHSKNKSTNASIGVGVTMGTQGFGFTLNAAASASRGNADGKDSSWTTSNVTAGNILGLQSGGNTSLIGATGQAKQIIASVGKNLRIETLQDTSHYESKQQSAGVSGTLCYGYCSSSISGNVSQGQMKSDFKSASEQAGLKAGDGGFIVDVKHNTTLIGGVIASSDKAVAAGLNTLSTGTLVTEDLKNSASYKASQVGISGGWSGSGSLGTDRDGNVAGGSRAEPGTSVPQTKSGVGMGTPVVAAASGNSSSTTQSGISGGKIAIRDEAGQLALTGKTAAETIASLNRDTTDTLNALKPIFDKEKIEAGFEIASEAQRQTGQFLTNRAKEIDRLVERSKDIKLSDDERKEAAEAAKKLNAEWGASGSYRRILTAVSAGATGNVTGTTASFAQSAAVNYLQGLAASEVKRLTATLGDGAEADAARAALHAIVGCAGASAKGGSCSAGALGAGAGSVLNALLSSDEKKLSAEEKEARRNLVESLVAGIAQGVGANVTDATFAAANETENNALSVPQQQARTKEMELCGGNRICEDGVTRQYKDVSDKQRQDLTQCASPEICRQEIDKASKLLEDYGRRADELGEKLREEILTAAEWRELSMVLGSGQLMIADRNAAIKRSALMGGSEIKDLVWDEIAKAGVAGAAAVGAVGSKTSTNSKATADKGGKGSAVPVFEPVMASNGLMYQSNPKHTPGQIGNRPNAGVEPKNSLELFSNSIADSGNNNHRYAQDAEGNIHRFFRTNNDMFHWSGSSGDKTSALKKDNIPNEIKKIFNVSGKGK